MKNENAASAKSGAEILADSLFLNGVQTVFVYGGNYVLDLFDALSRTRIRAIAATSEQHAVHAACAYAQVSGSTGVVIATSGPGATNLVTGIAAAWADSVPLVAITGNVPLSKIGTDSFQEVDITGVTMPVTKYNFLVKSADDVAAVAAKAFSIANGGRKGPVLIDLPVDAAQTKSTVFAKKAENMPLPPPRKRDLEKAAEFINRSERPLIILGGGATAAGAGELAAELSKKADCPVTATMMGLAATDGRKNYFLGMSGKYGSRAALYAQKKCDCAIAVGCRFSDRQTEDFAFKNLIHIDVDDAEIDKRLTAAVGIKSDAKDALSALLPLIENKKRGFIEEIFEREAKLPIPREVSAAKKYFDVISRAMPENSVVITDVGRHQLFAANLLKLPPRSFLTSGGLGEMGYGLGAAVGAFAASGRHVTLVTGDGSLMMSLPELANAVKLGLKLTIIVFNDNALGLVKQWQEERFESVFATVPDLPVDFAAAAKALGAAGFRAASPKSLASALKKAYSSADKGVPALVDLKLNKELRVKALF